MVEKQKRGEYLSILMRAQAHLDSVKKLHGEASQVGAFNVAKKMELAEAAVSESVALSDSIVEALVMLAGGDDE
ncbi:hypothetical protein HF888_07755 [Bermanella marisrubri]|uniref:Uncharacterized protein n=1 Tax=Bermanella marisrubri TaxID=207949 RepID=Q1N4Q6_9GAMM|nr:hypothetical protein [Bermanella marisrubri]EAT13372.1 hypothetical protein RED65_01390 [Oceanobacter sp. RED65] [Bermanella marisrubri]QIZ84127.1 hypothetical protein HF888_07755 [Bermanella marisrubri]